MSLNSHLSQSTWCLLGLYIGTSYVGLGTTYVLYPNFSARFFGVLQPEPANSKSTSQTTSTSPTALTRESIPLSLVNPIMQAIAVRDISIGVAILTFWNDGDDVAMGKVILSGMLIAIVDTDILRRLRNPGLAVGLAGAGVGWLVIGLALVGW